MVGSAGSGGTTGTSGTDGPRRSRSTRSQSDGKRSHIVGKRAAPSRLRSARSASSEPRRNDSADEGKPSRSASGAFVDARALSSKDYVASTLGESAGPLGVSSRPKVVDFVQRSKERRKASRRVVVVRALIAVAVACAAAGLIWLLFFSSLLQLRTSDITVEGANEWVSESQVLDIAGGQSGKSLLLVSSDEVVSQIKEIPGVTSATATKRFPHGLLVEIEAQKPAAMLKTSDESMTAVDSQGRVLNSVEDVSVDGIPVIEVDDVESSLDTQAIKEALKILASMSESMRQSVTSVTAETRDSITTTLNDGERIIVWGDSSDLELKKAVVDKIINDPNVIGDKQQVDVSAPLKPIIK
ncbi:cell division protein FtsQ/DivIB [Bifidobacterium lemurum]|nr:FtsQ-type POTRA domain-containing protein [Bifidobacterium lemurum]QOL35305.1 FtsQ-type POTRA domain-containing protein [Bifidobacterium lemurum]